MNHTNKSSLASFGLGLWLVALLALVPPGKAQILYTGNLGTPPEDQGWVFAALGPETETPATNSVILDTTASSSTFAGWTRYPAGNLNRTNGFTLLFSVQINSEAHSSTNRAGFSVICLGSDTNGIELGFWTNTVFAQSGSPQYFIHSEDATFATNGTFMNFALNINATNYILMANGTNLLSGPVRNYSGYPITPPIPDPYVLPNLIFLGDDTTSAKALVNLESVSLIMPPTLAVSTQGVVSWTGVSNQTYQVQESSNLVNWSSAGNATSPTNTFEFTNGISAPHQFFRVLFP